MVIPRFGMRRGPTRHQPHARRHSCRHHFRRPRNACWFRRWCPRRGSSYRIRSLRTGWTKRLACVNQYRSRHFRLESDTTHCSSSWDGATYTGVNWSYNEWYQLTDGSASHDTDSHKQVSSSNPFVNSGSYNWNLASDTNAGTNTHSLVAGNDVDMNGVSRGVDGVWDRGAFQISGSPSRPAPPTNLTATPH